MGGIVLYCIVLGLLGAALSGADELLLILSSDWLESTFCIYIINAGSDYIIVNAVATTSVGIHTCARERPRLFQCFKILMFVLYGRVHSVRVSNSLSHAGDARGDDS